MCSNVKVSGIPANVKLGKLLPLFSNILSMRSSDFLMRILPSNGPVKQILLSLPTYSEAQLAQEKLDNFVYKHNNNTYVFAAALDDGYKQNSKNFKPRSKFQNQKFGQSHKYQYDNQREEGCHRDRSRSPHFKDESSHLDMQIEILRKQRMILEEERKLLEEQRKLDQLKMKSFNNEMSSVAITPSEDVEMSGPSSNSSQKKFEPKQLAFHQASGVLLRKMNMFIQKHSSSDERKALLWHLRSILKQRLAAVVAADGHGVYQTHKVIILYRSQYPPLEDEQLVKEAVKDIKEGRTSAVTEKVNASAAGANGKNKPDGTETAADDTLQENNATSKDTNLPGDSKGSENINANINQTSDKKFERKRLFFHKASGVLVRKMNNRIDKHSPPEKRKLLVEYLRLTLKQHLADVVAGQPIYQTNKIIKLYRSQHPITEDEDLIKQLVKDIDEGRVTDNILMKNKTPKVDIALDEEKGANDNETTQDKMNTSTEGSNDSDQRVDNKENEVLPEKTDNEGSINEKNDKIEELFDNGSKVRGEEKCNKIKEELQNNLDTDNTKMDIVQDNCNADNEPKTDVFCTEDIKCYDDVKVVVEVGNHGIKRKTSDIDDSCIKVAKTDDIAVIGSEETNENELEDWN